MQAVNLALQLVDLDGTRVNLHTQTGRGLVDQIDCLVGQEPAGDVAVRQGSRGDQGAVADLHLVVGFVAALEPAQDADRVLDARLAHQDLLESPFQSGVFLDVLAVFVQGRGADHA